MDFGLDKEQEMLRKSFQEFLSKECPFDIVREIKKSDIGYSTKIWKKMAQLGWLGLVFEEKFGGMQGSFMDLFILFEEIGKVLLPSPLLFGNVLSGLMIQTAGNDDQKNSDMPLLIDGKAIITTALFDENGKMDKDQPGIEASKSGNGEYILTGKRLLVPYASVADKILLCANVTGDGPSGPTLLVVDKNAAGITYTPVTTVSDETSYAVIFENVAVKEKNTIGDIGSGNTIIDSVLPMATVLKCGEMIGGLRRVLDSTVAYAKDRHQFGKPIGSFQAVHHHCADMAIFLDGAVLIAYHAASLISQNKPCKKEVAMAKAWCSDAYKQSTWLAQQIHGGIGFTEEFNIQLFYKHAKESELLFGHAKHNLKIVADEMGL